MQVTAVLLAAALVVGVPAVAFSLPPLLGVPNVMSVLQQPTADAAPVTGATSDSTNDDDLSIRAVLPRALVRDVPMRLRLAVEGIDDDSLVAVTLQVDVAADAAGWLHVEPTRLLVETAGLSGADIRVLGFGRLPCSDTTGTLTVHVDEIAEPAGTGTIEVPVPGIPCDVDEPPPAPATVHLLDPVCGDDWRADAAALLEGRRPSDAWCRPTRRPAPVRDREDSREEDEDEPEEDEDDEPDEPEEPEEPDDEPDRDEPDQDDPDQDDPDQDDPDQDDPDDDPEAGENGDGGEGDGT